MPSPNPGGNVYTAKTDSDDRFESWNKVIQDVNELCENPDPGCDPIETLEEVGPDHVWIDEDVEKVRDKLMEICDENEFNAELDYWMHDIVQEISDAIDNGWCNCEKCQCEDEMISLQRRTQDCIVVLLQFPYGMWPPPCSTWTKSFVPWPTFDWYSAALGTPGFDEGIGGSLQIKYATLVDGEITGPGLHGAVSLKSLSFACSGEGFKSHTPPSYPLNRGDMWDYISCFYCGDYKLAGFPPWLYCGYNIIGVDPSHCGRCCEHEPVWPMDPDCDCPFDEGWVKGNCANYQAAVDACGHLFEQWWYALKDCPSEYEGEGYPCQTCCSDGIGFCPWDCPDDPVCEDGGGGGEE